MADRPRPPMLPFDEHLDPVYPVAHDAGDGEPVEPGYESRS